MTLEAGDLIGEIRAAIRHPGGHCSVGVVLAQMDPETAAEFRAAIDMPELSGEAISSVLRRRGYRVAGQTINRHRRGGCICDAG